MYKEVKQKLRVSFVQSFQCDDKEKRKHVSTSYEELSHFNDSAYELNILTFAFKID